MIALTQILQRLFTNKLPSATQIQTALEPVHEENSDQGCEFLNDFVTLEETSEDETA